MQPTSFVIMGVRLIDFPQRKSDGLPWDPLGGKPDIYFTIGKDGFKRIVHENVTHGKPEIWKLQKPFTATSLSQDVTFYFYDEDEQGLNLSKDDFMGVALFRPSLHLPATVNVPSTVSIKGNGITVELELIWK